MSSASSNPTPIPEASPVPTEAASSEETVSASVSRTWQRVQLARHARRPHSLDYIERLFANFEELHGDRAFGDDAALICGLADFEGLPVAIVAQQKGRDTKQKLHRNFGMPKPEGYRKALRVMKLASKFRLPLISLIDTPGAYPGIDAEERGQAEAIAVNLREMARLACPVITVVIGEGGSGGALAIGVGNHNVILENATYSVISPESCAAIIYRDSKKAQLAAEALKITAPELLALQLVDEIIPEPGEGAHTDWDAAAELLRERLDRIVGEMRGTPSEQLRRQRQAKFRRIASFFEEAAS
ncbi:MAG: acetyl-CoA carboxylase carboxyltransferase subunit alpha [Bryobacterales bacterium]|nr:acetyl-CoA carboxylase carboxyltransferase subunit alpha [Bryobacterales bacterium]